MKVYTPGILEGAYYAMKEIALLFDTPRPNFPTMMDADRTKARADWCAEEVQELRDATNVTEQVDASVDLIVFALGNLVENGVEPSTIFEMVIKSQYAKRWPDGEIHKREDGKVIKPAGWVAPDAQIEAHIEGLMKHE